MIHFVTINCENNERNWLFDTVQEIEDNWWSDDCTLPMLDDELVYAEVNGKVIKGEIFEDLAYALGLV